MGWLLGLVLCLAELAGQSGWRPWQNGLDAGAGQTVRLPTDGFAGELAEKLNQTGAAASQKMMRLADNARTQWIAGVSHDALAGAGS